MKKASRELAVNYINSGLTIKYFYSKKEKRGYIRIEYKEELYIIYVEETDKANSANINAANASFLTTGTVNTSVLGSGTANANTVLFGDQTYKKPFSMNVSYSGTGDYVANVVFSRNGTIINITVVRFDGTGGPPPSPPGGGP
jgi:hypothetical protein